MTDIIEGAGGYLPKFCKEVISEIQRGDFYIFICLESLSNSKSPIILHAKSNMKQGKMLLIVNKDSMKEKFITLISLNPKSSSVRTSLTTFKLRAKQTAPCMYFNLMESEQIKLSDQNGPKALKKKKEYTGTNFISEPISSQVQNRNCIVVFQSICNVLCALCSYLQDIYVMGINYVLIRKLIIDSSVLVEH